MDFLDRQTDRRQGWTDRDSVGVMDGWTVVAKCFEIYEKVLTGVGISVGPAYATPKLVNCRHLAG